jgi:hypothetical protein
MLSCPTHRPRLRGNAGLVVCGHELGSLCPGPPRGDHHWSASLGPSSIYDPDSQANLVHTKGGGAAERLDPVTQASRLRAHGSLLDVPPLLEVLCRKPVPMCRSGLLPVLLYGRRTEQFFHPTQCQGPSYGFFAYLADFWRRTW